MLVAPMLFAAFVITSFAQTNTPVAAVNSFYRYDRSHSQNFSRANIEARKAWFSSELYDLFRNEFKREDAYLKKNPGDKPYFEGLPFQPIDESCKVGRKTLHKALSVSHGTQNGRTATVIASFAFPKPCKQPDTTVYTLEMIKGKAGWLIDDVRYEDNRSLKGDLNRKDY